MARKARCPESEMTRIHTHNYILLAIALPCHHDTQDRLNCVPIHVQQCSAQKKGIQLQLRDIW